jgi:thiamine biosynthesis protein ThiS|tara:strand:- start:560 stop:760 length:201 start_codon:yes stop_codon:yes gene_type:complete
MQINLIINGKESIKKTDNNITVMELLLELGINLDTVIVRLNGQLCIEEERVNKGDKIEIIKAISGG